MKNLEKFDLNENPPTVATDNTLPVEPITKYEDPMLAITPPCSQKDVSKEVPDVYKAVVEFIKWYNQEKSNLKE